MASDEMRIIRERHAAMERAASRLKTPQSDLAPNVVACVQPPAVAISGGDASPRVYRASFSRFLYANSQPASDDFRVTMIGTPLDPVTDGGRTFTIRRFEGRWWGENRPILKRTIEFDYLAYSEFTKRPSETKRKTLSLPIRSAVSPELTYLGTGYTQGTSLLDLPPVSIAYYRGNGQYLKIVGNFLYDLALGWSAGGDHAGALNVWSPAAGASATPIEIDDINNPQYHYMIFHTLGYVSFALASIDGRWRLAQSIRVPRQHLVDEGLNGFPPNQGHTIDGAGFVAHRWGDPIQDDDGRELIEFAEPDKFDYWTFQNPVWTRKSSPPEPTGDPYLAGQFLTATDGTYSTPLPAPWAAAGDYPAFATFRVRMKSNI